MCVCVCVCEGVCVWLLSLSRCLLGLVPPAATLPLGSPAPRVGSRCPAAAAAAAAAALKQEAVSRILSKTFRLVDSEDLRHQGASAEFIFTLRAEPGEKRDSSFRLKRYDTNMSLLQGATLARRL